MSGQVDIRGQLRKNKVVRWVNNKLVDMDGVTITVATSYTLNQFLTLNPTDYVGYTIRVSDIPTPHSTVNGVLVEADPDGRAWIWIETPSFTSANLPTPVQALGWGRIFVSDIGVRGCYVYSDGIRFKLAQDSVVLVNNNADVALTGAPTSHKVFQQYAIPKLWNKSIWGDGDILEIHQIVEKTGAADTLVMGIYTGTLREC